MKKIVMLLAMIATMGSAFACTNIQIKAADNTLMVGRTLEFGPDLQSRLMNSPRERKFATTTEDGTASLQWTAQYGYLFVDFFMTGQAMDGMNEKGLSFSYLYLPGFTQYPKAPEGSQEKSLPYTSLGDWILGNFESVDEVQAALPGITVVSKTQPLGSFGKTVLPVHAVVTDKSGKSMVVEFVNGKMIVHQNPLGLLTNAPTFDWQLTNLQNYVNLSPYTKSPFVLHGITYNSTGQGSGLLGIPGDPTPPSRFVKMAVYQQTAMPVKDAAGALNLVEHILNTVDIPFGTVRGPQSGPSGPDTMDKTWWTVYKNLTNTVFYFKSYDNSAIQYLDMNKLDFSKDAKQFALPLHQKAILRDAMQDFMSKPLQ